MRYIVVSMHGYEHLLCQSLAQLEVQLIERLPGQGEKDSGRSCQAPERLEIFRSLKRRCGAVSERREKWLSRKVLCRRDRVSAAYGQCLYSRQCPV